MLRPVIEPPVPVGALPLPVAVPSGVLTSPRSYSAVEPFSAVNVKVLPPVVLVLSVRTSRLSVESIDAVSSPVRRR